MAQTPQRTLTLIDENPFSLEAIRARRGERFPEIGRAGLSRREQKIYGRAREQTLEIGLTRIKVEYALRETAALEGIANEQFLMTTTAIAHRLRRFHAVCPDEVFQELAVIFSIEGAKRLGGAMAAMADTAERQIADIVDRPLVLDEQSSLLARLFSGRR